MERYARDQAETADLLIMRERWDLLMEALSQIAPERRSVLVAHELEGQSIPEIALAQSIGEATAYTRLRLGREDLEGAARRLSARQRAAVLPLLVFFMEEERETGQRRERSSPWAIWGSAGLVAAAAVLFCCFWPGRPRPVQAAAGVSMVGAGAGDRNGERAAVIAGRVGTAARPEARPATKPILSPAAVRSSPGASSRVDVRDAGDGGARRERDERVYIEVARERLAAGRAGATRQVLRSHARAFPGGGYPGERASLSARAAPRP